MDVRKINASRRFNTYSKLVMIIIIIVYGYVLCQDRVALVAGFNPEKNISDYSCKQIEDLSAKNKVFADEKNKTRFTSDAVTVYYMKNCLDNGLGLTYWACMDGCSNMQEMLFNYTYDNESMKNLHDKCTVRCCHQYFSGECLNG